MPRDTIPVLNAVGSQNPAKVTGAGLAAVAANDGEFILTRGDAIVAFNPTAGAIEVTVVATVGADGRTEDAVQSVAVDEFAVFGPFDFQGWEQAGADAGKVFVDVDADGIELAVVRLAGTL